MPEMSPIKRKYRVQRPDGQIVEFMGSVDMGDDDIEKAGQFQSEIEQQRKSQKMMDAAQKFLPQTNSTLGKLAGGFADFMNTPATPSSEEYFNRISAGTGNEQPAQGFVDQMGQALTGSMLDAVGPFTSPTGLLSMAVPGAELIKSAAPAAKVAARALPRLFGAAAAPGAAMDINEAYQDPTTENVTRAMGSTGMAGLGLMTGKLPSVRGPGAPPAPPQPALPGIGGTGGGPPPPPGAPPPPPPGVRGLLGPGEPFQQPPQRPFNPPPPEGPYHQLPPSTASAAETGVIRPGPMPRGFGGERPIDIQGPTGGQYPFGADWERPGPDWRRWIDDQRGGPPPTEPPPPPPPGIGGPPEISGMGVQGDIPPDHPLAIHPRTAGIYERAAEAHQPTWPDWLGQEPTVSFPRSDAAPAPVIPFPSRVTGGPLPLEPLPKMPEPRYAKGMEPKPLREVTREPVMGEEFAKERSSRDERLAPEVLEQARADAASERATKLAPSPSTEDATIAEPAITQGELKPAPGVAQQVTAAQQKAVDIADIERARHEAKVAPQPTPVPTPEPALPEGVTKGEKGALGQMYDVETAQGKTTIAATPETIAQKAEETRKSFEAKPALPPVAEPVKAAPAIETIPEGQKATRTVKRGKPTPVVERPAQGVTTEGPIQPRTVGNFTIEASGDPKLPYQLREGDTVMSKGLKPDSFDAYVKRRAKEAAEQKAIEDKYRDVDEEVQPSDIPEGFQEVIPEEVAPPTEAEREAMGVKPKRVVNRAPKKKDKFPLMKKRPGEAGFARLAGETEPGPVKPGDADAEGIDFSRFNAVRNARGEVTLTRKLRPTVIPPNETEGFNKHVEATKKLITADKEKPLSPEDLEVIKREYMGRLEVGGKATDEQAVVTAGKVDIARRAGERGSISTKPAGKGPSDVTKGVQDLFKPITDAVAKLGPAGKEIARLMTRARLVGEHYAGTWESRAKDALASISDEEFGAINKDKKVLRGNLIDVLEGKAEPKNEKIAQAAAQIKQLLDETGTKGEQSGMTMEGGKQPNYFPHLYTEEFWTRIKGDPAFKNNILERMVKQNPGMTMNEASNILQRSRQFGERLISPQHERVFNLPGWERSKGALMKHLHDMGRQIANAEEIGPKDIAGDKLNKLIKDTTDPEYAYELLKRAMKRDEPPPIRDVKAVNKITTGASWAYLSRAAIGNLSQLTRVPLHTSFANTAKAFRQYLTDRQGFYREGLNSGAIVEIGAKGLMEEFGSKSKSYKIYGIESSEKFLRSVASAAGRSEAEAAFRTLKENPANKSARTQLADLLQEDVDAVLKQEGLTEKQSAIAGGRAAELTQGRAEAMDLPKKWSGSPYANLYFLYKKYALQDFRNMAKAVQKNPVKSLATIAVLNQAAGEFVGDAKEILKGLGVGLVKGDTAETIEQKLKDRGTYISKDNPLLGRILDNYLQSYTFGILADAAQNVKKGRYAGTIGEMAGDITSTAVATAQRAIEGKEKVGTPILKTATSMVPFIGPGLREGLFTKETKRKGPPRRVIKMPRRKAS